jgi:hypothetical protein
VGNVHQDVKLRLLFDNLGLMKKGGKQEITVLTPSFFMLILFMKHSWQMGLPVGKYLVRSLILE